MPRIAGRRRGLLPRDCDGASGRGATDGQLGCLPDNTHFVFKVEIPARSHVANAALRLAARLKRERCADRERRQVRVERHEVVTRCGTCVE